METIQIDGSEGEGGGQILRTSLALSVITGKPLYITRIRANRKKPGLMRQHLACVRAAAEISGASTVAAELNSSELTFSPAGAGAMPGNYHFAIGSAGSTSLVLQTVLMPLLLAKGDSEIRLEGGTHNPMAPPFPFLATVFVPLLRKMGACITLEMQRPGFAPAGGGLVTARVDGECRLQRLKLSERGKLEQISATAVTAGGLPGEIAKRELQAIANRITIPPQHLLQRSLAGSAGPGNYVGIEVKCEHVTELFTAIGQLGKRAESVANEAVDDAREYLAAEVPVGQHLADQLLLPLALGQGGSFMTTAPSLHTRTNIDVIRKFLNVTISAEPTAEARGWEIVVSPKQL